MLKSLSQMSLTILLKFIMSLIVISIIARTLKVEEFGQFMIYMAAITLVTLFINFGLNTYILRELPRVENKSELVNHGMLFKIIISVVIIITAILFLVFFDFLNNPYVWFILLLTLISDNFSDYFLSILRAFGRFDIDLKISALSSALNLSFVYFCHLFSSDIISFAMAYLMGRIISLIILVIIINKHVVKLIFELFNVLAFAKKTLSYALDVYLGALFGNIDSIILSKFLGVSVVGIYQGGMRLTQTTLQSASVFTNVFLPRISSSYGKDNFKKEVMNLQFCYILLAMLTFYVFSYYGSTIVDIVYSSKYSKLYPLMPLFGLLCAYRFIIASVGVIVTSAGGQKFRTILNIFCWLIVLFSSDFFISKYDIYGWFYSLYLGHVFLLVGYLFWVIRRKLINKITIIISLLSVFIFSFGIFEF